MHIYAHTAGPTSMMLPVTNLMIKKDNVKLSKHGAFPLGICLLCGYLMVSMNLRHAATSNKEATFL